MRNKGLSERRAARLVGVSRTVLRYKRRRRDDTEIRRALRKIALSKRAYGYRMLWRKLRQQGYKVNLKRVYRIYREEKLTLRRKRRRKTPEYLRVVIPTPEAANVCWSMDFVSDSLIDGRALRILTVVDDATRESVGLRAAHSLFAILVVKGGSRSKTFDSPCYRIRELFPHLGFGFLLGCCHFKEIRYTFCLVNHELTEEAMADY